MLLRKSKKEVEEDGKTPVAKRYVFQANSITIIRIFGNWKTSRSTLIVYTREALKFRFTFFFPYREVFKMLPPY